MNIDQQIAQQVQPGIDATNDRVIQAIVKKLTTLVNDMARRAARGENVVVRTITIPWQ